jgi:hypothetical protein
MVTAIVMLTGCGGSETTVRFDDGSAIRIETDSQGNQEVWRLEEENILEENVIEENVIEETVIH